VLVCLHHLGEVVLRTGEGRAFSFEKSSSVLDGGEGLRVEGEFAVQVVGDIGYGDGLGGGYGLVLGEFPFGEGKGDAF
jgi:hypothetical protein